MRRIRQGLGWLGIGLLGVLGSAQAGEGVLKIIAWPGYMERGQNDARYDWVTPFEQETGCKISVRTALNSDEMVNLMMQGGHDLVTASGDASLRLVFANKVAAINPIRIIGWESIDARLRQGPWLNVADKVYGVPFLWGPNVLLYDTRLYPQPPNSWAALFEAQTLADGQSNQGRVQMHHGPMAIAEAALYLMKQRPALGIADPYELSPEQYAEVLQLLRRQRERVQRYWSDPEQQIRDFRLGGLAASSGWGYTANALRSQGAPVRAVLPREGATGWVDSLMLHRQAAHPVCAYQWMNYVLRPAVQIAVAEWFGANPATPAACRHPAPAGSPVCRNNDYGRFAELHFWRTPQANCRSQSRCMPYSSWARDYAQIVSGR